MLSSHEADLVKREVAIPGLATLLDPEAFAATLQSFIPGANRLVAHPSYIRYKPGMNCLIAYRVENDENRVSVYAKAHGHDAPVKLRKATLAKTVPGQLGPGRIVLDDIGVVISFFPNDSNLKRLRRIAETEARHHLLKEFLPHVRDQLSAKMESLAYKPERRYVAKVTTESNSSTLLKFYTPQIFHTTQQSAIAFTSHGFLRIPRCLGKSNRYSVIAFEWLEGRLLGEIINEGEPALKAVEETGAALAQLHAQDPDGLGLKTRETEAATILEMANWLSFVHPPIAERAKQLAKRLASWLQTETQVQKPIHGDFYAKQVLWSEGCARVVDLDEAVRGDPRFDLCLFVARLEQDAIRGKLSAESAPALKHALLDGYMQAGGQPSLRDMDWYTAVALFQLSHEPFRACEPGWIDCTEAILDRIESILMKSELGKSRLIKTAKK
ncbi:MAG: phosphotransferase family protein [bacterium]